MSGAMVAAAGAAVAVAAAAAQLEGVEFRGWPSRAGARDEDATAATDGRRRAEPASARHRRGSERAVSGVVGACVGLLAGGLPAALVLGAAGVAGAVLRARHRRVSRRCACEQAAPSLARALADALRGGASVRSALAGAADDRSVPAALRAELSERSRAVRLGAPVEGSLVALAALGGPTLRLLCGTVVMHLDAGGALAGELERLAADGEAALRIDEDRVAATAQARATVRVVAALPVLALVGAELASTDFLPKIAEQPASLALLLVGLGLEVTAIVVARAIVGGR